MKYKIKRIGPHVHLRLKLPHNSLQFRLTNTNKHDACLISLRYFP